MEHHHSTPDRDRGPWLPAKQVCARYQIVTRTLDRWIADPAMAFPPPLYINGRRFHSEPELIEWERRRAATAA